MTRTLAAVLQAVLLIFAALGASAATAELVNENILIVAPPGYKVGFRDKKPETQMTEFVPANQTVENWTEMVTVQVFFGLKATPEEFMRELEKRWRAACPGAEDGAPVASGPENGYPTLVWILNCPQNPGTGKPEITWFKAVQGNDSFYLVQKAFKFTPTKEQVIRWVGYLKKVGVCDLRIADRACPKSAN